MTKFDVIFFILVEIGLPIGIYIYIYRHRRVLWNGEAIEEFKPSRGVQ